MAGSAPAEHRPLRLYRFPADRMPMRRATCRRDKDLRSAIRAPLEIDFAAVDASRSRARPAAASARSRSISSARSAVRARIRIRSGRISAKPNAAWRWVFSETPPEPDLADLERHEQGCMPRQHAEISLGARKTGFIDRLVDDRPIGGHDLDDQVRRQRHRSGLRGLRGRLLLGVGDRFLDRADHVERLLRQMVVFAVDDLLEAANRVGNSARTCLPCR